LLKSRDSELFQVQVHSCLFSECSMYTNSCVDLGDPRRSHPDEACEACRLWHNAIAT